MVFGGSLGAAESYLDGKWVSDDLTGVIRLFARNDRALNRFDRYVPLWVWSLRSWFQKRRANSRRGSRRNIAAHYDLGNDFFRQFLDPTMTYSCGLFPTSEASLQEASEAKYERIARQLALQPGDRVVEVGGGWGGFAIYAARHFGCYVTTTTISQEQFSWAQDRIRREGLEDRIRLLKQDYRDLSGKFDKLVSIEMVEAVGRSFLHTYFKKCCELLTPQGTMLIQAIVIPEQRLARYERSLDFIQRYIFPGGFLPSLGLISQAIRSGSDLQMLQLHDFAHHYARTLEVWHERFRQRADRIRRQGFDERFLRAWDYYFSYCQAAFRERRVGVVQMLLARPGCSWGRLPSSDGLGVTPSIDSRAKPDRDTLCRS